MTRPRKDLISIHDTPYYHIVSRCVRRAFLCGTDPHTQQSYEHRRQWVEDRIRLLSSLFAIDICAYAVMSNHYHLVVKLSPSQVDNLSDNEVVHRWTSLFRGPLLIQRYQQGQALSTAEKGTVDELIHLWRQRLTDLSWFMKCLNQPIAQQANKEDGCTGHFWEGRYKSQALLSQQALLSCMAYVDLNPIRANLANTPETSEHTSIKERIKPTFNIKQALHNDQRSITPLNHFTHSLKPLLNFDGYLQQQEQTGIPFLLTDYLQLVDETGRVIREDKRGHIHAHFPPILERLGITNKQWITQTTRFEQEYQKSLAKRKVNQKSLST